MKLYLNEIIPSKKDAELFINSVESFLKIGKEPMQSFIFDSEVYKDFKIRCEILKDDTLSIVIKNKDKVSVFNHVTFLRAEVKPFDGENPPIDILLWREYDNNNKEYLWKRLDVPRWKRKISSKLKELFKRGEYIDLNRYDPKKFRIFTF